MGPPNQPILGGYCYNFVVIGQPFYGSRGRRGLDSRRSSPLKGSPSMACHFSFCFSVSTSNILVLVDWVSSSDFFRASSRLAASPPKNLSSSFSLVSLITVIFFICSSVRINSLLTEEVASAKPPWFCQAICWRRLS